MRNRLIQLVLLLCFLGCRQQDFYEVVELEDSIEPTIINKNLYWKIGDDQDYLQNGYAVKSGSAIKISSNPIQCDRFPFGNQAEEEGDMELEIGVIADKVELINAAFYLPKEDRVFHLNQSEDMQSEINLRSFSEDSIAGSVLITNQHDSNFDLDSVVISFSLPIRECDIDYLMTNLRSGENFISDIFEGYAAISGFDSIRRVLYFASFSEFECDTSTTSGGGIGISAPLGSDAFPENSDSLEVILVVGPHAETFWSWVQIKEGEQTLSLMSRHRSTSPCGSPDMNFKINIEYEDDEIIQGTFDADYYTRERKQDECDVLTFFDHLTFNFRMNFKNCGSI